MFSVRQKREIADKIQEILRETNHPELPEGEISFRLSVVGAEDWSWADIRNNGAISDTVTSAMVNPWNEKQTKTMRKKADMAAFEHMAMGLLGG